MSRGALGEHTRWAARLALRSHGRAERAAACCHVHGIALATFNVKDYTDFPTHEACSSSSRPGAGELNSRAVQLPFEDSKRSIPNALVTAR